jgi:DNA replication and repair protein RecF
MHLHSLELHDFRSFAARQFDFSPGINIIYGPNASGKTNILEAIYVLANLKSFRTNSLREVISWNKSRTYIRGLVQQGQPPAADRRPASKALAVSVDGNTRIALINSKPSSSSKEYLQVFPSTAFIPDDLSLVKGAPVFRRSFLDRGTFHYYPPYWALLTDYHKILRQKNTLLREMKRTTGPPPTEESVDIWNEQLQRIGSKIILQRLLFVRDLQRLLAATYQEWLGGQETVTLRYTSSIWPSAQTDALLAELETMPAEAQYQTIQDRYGQAIQRNLRREQQQGTTVVGPHRDDLDLRFSGHPLRAFGSQGQQRTAVLALKLAEALLYFERYTEYPALLLDDVTSELDDTRNARLLHYLQRGMQVFITTTNKPEWTLEPAVPSRYFDLSA